MTGQPAAYRIRITLQGTDPAVWREVVLPGQLHLGQVHDAVQRVMGWQDAHLHEFEAGEERYGDGEDNVLETTVRLQDVVRGTGECLLYSYDFGDDWVHTLQVEEVLPAASEPRCLAGQGACPPEDCGGPWGYEELLAVLADPTHPEHEERLDWLGGPLDPGAFDLEQADRALRVLS
ncbi:MAG: plasmid pRiA4b family protein [Frankiales bacterium]|nr:plasmid pRiA4b family protein [Frankiales bacterium]